MARHFSGILLKKHRRAKDLTYNDLAVATGKSTYMIRSYEYEEALPNAAFLGQIADVLGVGLEDLYEHDDDTQVAA